MFRRNALWALLILAVNVLLNGPLAAIRFSEHFSSNEGSFVALARAQVQGGYSPGDWWPYWNGGMPFAFTYPPLLPKLTALLAAALGAEPVRVFHVLGAAALIAGPLTVFVLARWMLRSQAAGFFAALFYSLVSPSALLFPWLRIDAGDFWGLRRLQTLLVYGETPHVAALVLVPLVWLAYARKAWVLAIAGATFVLLTNSYGAVAVAVGCTLWLVASKPGWKDIAWSLVSAAATYAIVMPWWPPSLLRLLAANTAAPAEARPLLVGILAALVAARWLLRRQPVEWRFIGMLATFFGALVSVASIEKINVIFHAYRYQHEFDLALAILAGTVLARWWKPSLVLAAGLFVWDARAVWTHHHSSRPEDSIQYQVARELQSRYPGHRVMASGSAAFWLNEFTDLPQLSGGHDPMAHNRAQQIAVYTIYTGQNAGARDAEISELWLKAFGVAAIYVPGRGSREFWKPFVNPRKFDGVLPVAWQTEDDRIYAVPGVTGLAHLVPADALVLKPPLHGLDVDQLRKYVEALRPAKFSWIARNQARVTVPKTAGDVLSLQVNYFPGWKATVDSRPVDVRADGIGLIWLDPACKADSCVVELTFAP